MSFLSYCSNFKHSKIKMVTTGTILLSVSFSGIGYASGTPVSVVMDGIKYPIGQASPFSDRGTTFVPLRFVSDKMGAKLNWDPKTQKIEISKGDIQITLTVGSSVALVNGATVQLDSSVMQKEGVTMIPLRFVSEQLSAEVNWDPSTGTVSIHMPDTDVASVDPYGRKIRTTNLPKNYKDFPYILEDTPNEMYEMPAPELADHTPAVLAQTNDNLFFNNPKLMNKWKKNAEDYFNLVLNMDYRTIDDQWAVDLYSHHNQSINYVLTTMKEHVAWVEKNKVITEGSLEAEPSMVFKSKKVGLYYIRTKFTFKINSYNEYKNIFFDDFFKSREKFKKDVWYTGYADIALSTNVIGENHRQVAGTASLFRFNTIIRKLNN